MNMTRAQTLSIFVGETDKYHGVPVYEEIVRAARKHGMAGATALRATMGYGHNSRVHTAKLLELSEDLPMVVTIIDRPEKIAAFLPVIESIGGSGVITIQDTPAWGLERGA
jgi:PII-like signaling protein